MTKFNFRDTFKRFPEYADAIVALRPGAGFGINMNDYTSLYWDPNNTEQPPTEDEIKEKVTELIAEWELNEYRRQRYIQYTSVEEQLALLWDDMDAGIIPGKETSAWYSHIKEIKEQFPKPE
jgi:tRNA U34 5-methylaminomethyl-2-thiouridine-forming methyltransferase MnmC